MTRSGRDKLSDAGLDPCGIQTQQLQDLRLGALFDEAIRQAKIQYRFVHVQSLQCLFDRRTGTTDE